MRSSARLCNHRHPSPWEGLTGLLFAAAPATTGPSRLAGRRPPCRGTLKADDGVQRRTRPRPPRVLRQTCGPPSRLGRSVLCGQRRRVRQRCFVPQANVRICRGADSQLDTDGFFQEFGEGMQLSFVMGVLGFLHGDGCFPQGPAARSCPSVVWQPDHLRKTCRSLPLRKVQAMTKSQAGSPIPQVPKSMTAESCPSAIGRFRTGTSP